MDKIRIENLEIFAKHGVFPEENFLGQKFVLSAVLHTDTRKAGLTDELSYSVHYGEVSHLIKKRSRRKLPGNCWRRWRRRPQKRFCSPTRWSLR